MTQDSAPDIFLCYAHEDHERARILVEALENEGWSVFWDREIPPGAVWRKFISARLTSAGCVVVAWSEASVDSTSVLEEAERAKRRGALVPVRLDEVELALGFGEIQAPSLVGWTGDRRSVDFQQVVAELGKRLGTPQPSHSPGVFPPSVQQVSPPTSRAEDEPRLVLAWGEPSEGENLALRWVNRTGMPIENVATNGTDLRYWHEGRFLRDNKPKEAYWSGSRTVNPFHIEDQPDQVVVESRGDSFEVISYRSPAPKVLRAKPGMWVITATAEMTQDVEDGAEEYTVAATLFFSWDPERSPRLRAENDPRIETAGVPGGEEASGGSDQSHDLKAYHGVLETPLGQKIFWDWWTTEDGIEVRYRSDSWPRPVDLSLAFPEPAAIEYCVNDHRAVSSTARHLALLHFRELSPGDEVRVTAKGVERVTPGLR